MLAVSLGLLAVLLIMMSGSPVTVSKSKPIVEIKNFDPKNPPADVGEENDGITHWKFLCPTEVNYQLVEEVSDDTGSFVRIKVIGVNVKLALRITEWLPNEADSSLKDHEGGHAEICKRIYEEADGGAQELAKMIVGKTFAGNGANSKEACKAAGSAAISEFSSMYEESIAMKAQQISEIYDMLARHRKVNVDKLIETSFELYEKGRPRTISRVRPWSHFEYAATFCSETFYGKLAALPGSSSTFR